jgi:hypothetical protein
MPRRSILTERQRASLLDLPTDEVTILHHYDLPHLVDEVPLRALPQSARCGAGSRSVHKQTSADFFGC